MAEKVTPAARSRPALWQMALVVASLALMVVGAAIGYLGGSDAPDNAPLASVSQRGGESSESGETSRRADGLASGFLPGGTSFPGAPGSPGSAPVDPDDPDAAASAEIEASPPTGSDLLSPALFKLGFGFFIGFSMAYAVRTFMKVSLVAAGFFAMLLFGLQYAGIIEVNWSVMADRYDSVAGWIGAQTQSFGAFVSGALPGTGAALAGGVIGLRRG